MEVIIDESLAIDPVYELRKDGLCLADSLDSAFSTNGAANAPIVPYRIFLLLRWNQASTKRTR